MALGRAGAAAARCAGWAALLPAEGGRALWPAGPGPAWCSPPLVCGRLCCAWVRPALRWCAYVVGVMLWAMVGVMVLVEAMVGAMVMIMVMVGLRAGAAVRAGFLRAVGLKLKRGRLNRAQDRRAEGGGAGSIVRTMCWAMRGGPAGRCAAVGRRCGRAGAAWGWCAGFLGRDLAL